MPFVVLIDRFSKCGVLEHESKKYRIGCTDV